VLVIDILAVALVDAAVLFHLAPGSVALRPVANLLGL